MKKKNEQTGEVVDWIPNDCYTAVWFHCFKDDIKRYNPVLGTIRKSTAEVPGGTAAVFLFLVSVLRGDGRAGAQCGSGYGDGRPVVC